MGALHAGHRSLLERAAAECDAVAMTLFVNPLQFVAGEDLDRYPRRLEEDLRDAASAGAGVVFAPSSEAMYPQPFLTTVHLDGPLTETLEGAARPGHFDGVTTVVAKLFSLAGRCRAYFGEKDYQQLLVVRRLVEELALPVEVIGCPTVREPDGLAASSRNAYLGPAERRAAPVLHRALGAGAALVEAGAVDPAEVAAVVEALVAEEPLVRLDYVAVVDALTLQGFGKLGGEIRILLAARLGGTRLIDNIGARARGRPTAA